MTQTANFISTDCTLTDLIPEWMEYANCSELASEVSACFFSNDPSEIATAKNICAKCTVVGPCLEGALSRGEPWGVWGGQLFAEGAIVNVKRRRGRPSKDPNKSNSQLPVVPVPAHLEEMVMKATIKTGQTKTSHTNHQVAA